MSDLKLDTLEAKGLITIASFQPELEYLFRHALVQDAAYGSLLKQERKVLHQLVGESLETLYPERVGELAAVLAMHFEQAGEADKAVRYLLAAASFAYERNAIREAFDLYGRASALLPPESPHEDQETRRRRVQVDLGRLKSGLSFTSHDETLALVGPLIRQAEALADLRLEAEVHIHAAFLRLYEGERYETSERVRASLDRVTEIARQLDDPLIAALPRSLIGLFQVWTGDLRSGVAALRETAPLLEQKHDFVGSSFALVALAIGLARLGEFDEATAAARQATEVGERGDLIAKLDALIGESTVRSLRGDLEGAVPLALQCTDLSEQTGATACVVASNFVLGDAYMRQGRFKDARIVFERGDEVATTIDQKIFRPSISAYLRSTAASLGIDLKAATFDQALAEARAVGDKWGEANVIWKRAETEAKRPDGDREHMLADFALAGEMFERMGARPHLARLLRDWGRALRAVGREDEATDKLRRSASLFTELGIEREASELRRELSAEAAAG